VSTHNAVQPDAVRSQLNRILQSSGFADSPRLSRLLRYLVQQKLEGKADGIKEYSVGLEVFDRPFSFDPRTDSIVRASARKLRAKLGEYYQNGGSSDPVVIDVPKGGYVPKFQAAPRTIKRRILPAATAAALILAALNALGWRSAVRDAHPSVAVLDVGNASGNDNDAWLSTALAETITEDLSANEGLQTVSTEQVAQLRRDLAPAGMRTQIQQRGPELHDRLGAKYAVLADFHVTGGNGVPELRVDTRLERLRDGRIVLQSSDRGSETQLYTLSAHIARKIRLALGVPRAESAVRNGPDRESMRLYAEAVLRLRDSDPLAARGLLEKSAGADPSNFLARSLLADTYVTLGMEAQAKIEAQAALALAPPLPPVERLALEARCYSAMRDYPAAIRSYQTLWRISPEVLEYGFNAADLQEKSGRDADASQTLQALRKMHPSPADEARIDFAESSLRARAGEFQKALALARRCERTAGRLDARYLYARARLREGGLLMNLVMPGARAALDEGLAICRAQGYRFCEMNALRQEGNLFLPVDPQRATELYAQGAAIARQMGNRRGLVELLRGMAAVADRQLLDKEAEQRDREVMQVIQDEKVSDKAGYVDLAELLVAEGRLDDAERFLRQTGRASGEGFAWNLCMASLQRARGEYSSAARRVEAQVEIARKTDDRFAAGLALAEAFRVHLDQGDLRRAAADARELEKVRPFDARAPYLRAELALLQGKWEEAESQADEANRQLRRVQEVDRPLEAAVAVVRAEALTEARHAAEALRVLDEIAPVLDGSRRAPLQLRARICRLRAQALLGACPGGAQFQDLLGAARKLGIPPLVRETESVGTLMRVRCGTAIYAASR
jgi:tetratricopeptide (TPR) repeat protein/TolB-like protein